MNQVKFDHIKSLLESRPNERDITSYQRSASVALVIGGAHSQDILFIHRSEREGDPWSGHIAFPGGGTEEQDENSRITAIRETCEEVGLNLQAANYLGLLKSMQLHKLGSPIDFGLECHVFHLPADFDQELKLEPGEVDEAFWVSLTELYGADSIAEETFHFSGLSRTLPCIKVRGKIIWGITYMLLVEFQKVLHEIGRSDLLSLPPYPYAKD